MNKSLRSKQHKALQEALKQARLKANMTQQQLASNLRKPQSFIAKYEGGERRLDIVEFIWICEAIGTDTTEIINQITSTDNK